MVVELVQRSGCTLCDQVEDRFSAFPSSGKINFKIKNAAKATGNVLSAYRTDALSIDITDGVCLMYKDWRFNLRRSNTQSLEHLIVESKGGADTLKVHGSAIVYFSVGQELKVAHYLKL